MVAIGIIVGAAFFAGLVTLLAASYTATAHEPSAPHLHAAAEDECLLCRARLPRIVSADEAVADIERRIDADRRDAAPALAPFQRRTDPVGS